MKKFFIFFVFLIFIIILQNGYAEIYDINMPTGSASPDAPYFWQNEKTGEATGDIEILIGDSVVWKNGDQAQHTITSGTVKDGPDGIFGGPELLAPGDSYKFTFLEKGNYPYFCLIHPWMTGVVTVTDGYQLLADVGKDAGDGLTTFDVDYQFEGKITSATVNRKQQSITFNVFSDPKSLDYSLVLMLPKDLIEGPYAIFVDGEKNLQFDYFPGNEVNTIKINLSENVKQMTVVGTNIVPEFGIWSVIILGIAFTTIIFLKPEFISKF